MFFLPAAFLAKLKFAGRDLNCIPHSARSIVAHSMKIWLASAALILFSLGPLRGQSWVKSVAFSPDGRTLASGSNKT